MKSDVWKRLFVALAVMGLHLEVYAGLKHTRHRSRSIINHRYGTDHDEEVGDTGYETHPWTMIPHSQGRKVSLNGMPMAGNPPDTESDSDYYREDTHLDAFSLDVQHSVTDIHIPVGSEHLALEVRRTLTQEIWGNKGLSPDQRPDKPFGKGWISSLAPSVYWSRDGWGDGYYYVTDHTGQQYTFLTTTAVGTHSSPIPLSSSGQDAMDLMKTSFVKNGDGTFSLTLPSGTVLTYSGLGSATQTQRTTSSNVTIFRYHQFARLMRVTDRHGVYLEYTGGFIPTKITAYPAELSLMITQSNGLVTAVTDPRGNTTQYTYDSDYEYDEDNDNGASIRNDPEGWDYLTYTYEYSDPSVVGDVLHHVERENGAKTTYQYWYLLEEDYRYYSEAEGGIYPTGMYYKNSNSWKDAEDQHHLNIRAITDANSNTYSFAYTTDPEEYATHFYDSDWYDFMNTGRVHVRKIGAPRRLTQVSRPDEKYIYLGYSKVFGTIYRSNKPPPTGYIIDDFAPEIIIPTNRTTYVRDASGERWNFDYQVGPSLVSPYNDEWMQWRLPTGRETVAYGPRKLVISNQSGFRESIQFDPIGIVNLDIPSNADANPTVVGVKKETDQWGNTTTFDYRHMPTTGYVQSTSLSKPTERKDAYGKISDYWFNTSEYKVWQADYEEDRLDRKTEYEWHGSTGNVLNGLLFRKTVKSGSTLVQKTTYDYDDDSDWPAFVIKKTEWDIGTSDPSFVQREISYTPHSQGLVEREVIDPGTGSGYLNITTTYGYDSNNNQTVVIDPNNHTNWFAYDALNRLVAITNADFTVRSFGYDARGNKTSETNENDKVTFWQYDSFNRVTNVVIDLNENGIIDITDISTKTTYDVMGNVSSVTDPNGIVTTNQYDDLQRLTNSIIDPGGVHYVTKYEYGDNSGSLLFAPYGFKPTKIVDAENYETIITYDKLYRETQRQRQVNHGDAVGQYAKTTFGYDFEGNLRYTTNWVSATEYQVTQNTYDALNQPYTTIYDDNTSIITDYTSSGLLYQQRDENLNWTTTLYDKAQRPWKVTLPAVDGQYPVTETGYDDAGNVTSITDPRTNTTTFVYDERNRRTHEILPLVWDEESQSTVNPTNTTYYDGVGNVTAVLDARQNLTTNLYDAANRLTNSILPAVAVYGDGTTQPSTTTTYDKNGNPRYVTDANEVTIEMQYDVLNRLKKTIDGELHEIEYGYDASGNRSWIKDQNSNYTDFEYDGLNNNTKITYADKSKENYDYDWLGNRTSRTDAKGQVTEYDYDVRNRLDLVSYMSNSIPSRTRDYVYDNAGNLLDVYESANPLADVHYTYDALNRVRTETSCGVMHEYGYDLAGNRTSAEYGVTAREVEWAYDGLNRIQTITDTKGYTATVNHTGADLQATITSAPSGSRILVPNGTYGPVSIDRGITVQSENGAASATIQGTGGRCAALTNNARLVGFTLTGGSLVDAKGAGALVGKGCLVADCLVSNNIASGVNAYGGGLFLQAGATAQNCEIVENKALNGGGVFCEKGGLVRNCTIEGNEAESMGGGGVFMQDGGWIANSIIDGNIATNSYARGGGGVLFYNNRGRVNSSTIANNTSTNNGAAYSHRSTLVDPGKVGEMSHSIIWSNTPSGTSNGWVSEGNIEINPSSVVSAPGADLATGSYEAPAVRTTQFRYDLNSNMMERELPSGAVENRLYDALNRLVANTNTLSSVPFYSVEYIYDAVGNLRQMDDAINGLHTIAGSASWSWTYDDAYRLRSEYISPSTGATRETQFDWDDAGNRTVMRKYSGGTLTETTSYKKASQLNQMLGWTCGTTNALYTYDANGNRDNKFITVGDETETTDYGYDEDNRLTSVTVRDTEQPKEYAFAYDYRTRLISRATPTETTTHVFDGGLSVQEFDTSEPSSLTVNNLTTESIRTAGYGGGVGGMVYSIRNGQIEVSHSNHRGDVVARTDNGGDVTWFARYEAYGTRFDEFGATYDRQRGNTKDEEEELGFINDGMRPRSLEHGCYLTRDPAGYVDTPNLYLYVRNNPITMFDPTGLEPKEGTPLLILWKGMLNGVEWGFNKTAEGLAWVDDQTGGALESFEMAMLSVDLTGQGYSFDDVVAGALVGMARYGRTLRNADKMADSVDTLADAGKTLNSTQKTTAATKTAKAVKTVENSSDAGKTVSQAATKKGRGGRQTRLKEIADDPNTSKVDKGWIKQEQNSIKNKSANEKGNPRKNIRNPPGKDLAHPRGKEAAKGNDHVEAASNLQDKDLHKLQHKHDNQGRKNKAK